MTEAQEIARNAKKALKTGKITKAQYNDVRLMLVMAHYEKKLFGKYRETKGQK